MNIIQMSLQVEPSKHTSESIEDLMKLIKERIISALPKCLFCDHKMDPLGEIDHLNRCINASRNGGNAVCQSPATLK
ncbi:hypothetical protein PPL_00665 [Heterostelium album PN500]|uniref:Uncharacterized protein n=1 Tax=Heterostelium pallidum (strain ATCC 26659 / Pp 5 / PN500) TaxID=670386 RepID=D3AX36_HETP5|nr:hypothetical protein PPL_00665 [Heterostelium album PN500]EFA86105.1 hypothetical protein PPL_00665 [Heterostelium album PN500]|eukprot:XP_020438211.1 hypothetical protein PPL_00665 [Heterostelium album PN500]